MLMYAIIFGVLGFLFPPLWILSILFLTGSIFGDVGKILIAIISFPFKLIGFFMSGDEEETRIVEKQAVVETQSSNADQLMKLSELLEKGHISQDDFDREKAKILA